MRPEIDLVDYILVCLVEQCETTIPGGCFIARVWEMLRPGLRRLVRRRQRLRRRLRRRLQIRRDESASLTRGQGG